jgi:hypothetical protein
MMVAAFPSDDVELCFDLDAPSVVTTSQYGDDDDHSEVSSVSSTSSLQEQLHREEASSGVCDDSPRSIFKSYWSKEGQDGAPISLHHRFHDSPRSARANLLLLDAQTASTKQEKAKSTSSFYEQSLQHVEVRPKPSRPWESNPLSSVLKGLFLSLPELERRSSIDKHDLAGFEQRKSKSTSALHSTPLRSALRNGRFAQVNQDTAATASCKNVAFQTQVDVYRFEVPKESWAPEGWSSWFSY